MAELFGDVLPGIIRVGGADDHLKVGIFRPDMFDRLDAIPTRRHTHVHEREGVRPTCFGCFQCRGAAFLTLRGAIDFEGAGGAAVNLFTEQGRLGSSEAGWVRG